VKKTLFKYLYGILFVAGLGFSGCLIAQIITLSQFEKKCRAAQNTVTIDLTQIKTYEVKDVSLPSRDCVAYAVADASLKLTEYFGNEQINLHWSIYDQSGKVIWDEHFYPSGEWLYNNKKVPARYLYFPTIPQGLNRIVLSVRKPLPSSSHSIAIKLVLQPYFELGGVIINCYAGLLIISVIITAIMGFLFKKSLRPQSVTPLYRLINTKPF